MSDDHPTEIFRVVPDFPNYRVSNWGRVQGRRWRKNPNAPWRDLAARVESNGYRRITLCNQGKQRRVHVHVLVAELFIGPRPDGMHVLHRDDNKLNNRADNLRYGTCQDNADDWVRNGRSHRGSRNPHARFTEEDVAEMYRLRAQGWLQWEIGEKFGVRQSTIGLILTKRTWKHFVPPQE